VAAYRIVAAGWGSVFSLDGIQFPKGLAAFIAGNSDDGIRVSAAIQPVSAVLTGSLFQNRSHRRMAASYGNSASAAFVFCNHGSS